MGSYISLKTQANSCGSSAGISLVHSFFEDLLEGVRSIEAKAYVASCYADAIAGRKTDALPTGIAEVSDFGLCYQAYNFLRKTRLKLFSEPASTEVMESEAIAKLLDVERRNKYINDQGYIPGWSASAESLGLHRPEQVIFLARLKLASLLGDFCFDEFSRNVGFSSGASTRLPRRRGAAPYKFQGKPHVTRQCALLAVNLIWFHEPWRQFCQNRFGRESDPCTWVKVVDGSEYFTVPKTATTLRGAAKEPEMNMFCQKAIGNMIRKRLKQRGVDLNNQELNKDAAYRGSLDGSLATLDLSSASDSVSCRLLDLLPPSWREVIMMTRSERIKIRDDWHNLEMVSSMGNGFTFELESALFWAVSAASAELAVGSSDSVNIYGDDIVVPTPAAETVIHCLGYLGFEVNESKSFTAGPFRESCGGHYFLGVDVTPFFLRDELDAPGVYHLLNAFNAWAWNYPGLEFSRTLKWAARNLPRRSAVVPPHAGTRAGIIPRSIHHARGVYFCLRKQAYVYHGHREVLKSSPVAHEGGYLAWLNNPGGEITLCGSEVRARRFVQKQATSRWADACVRFACLGAPL